MLTEGHFEITISLTMWALTDRAALDVNTDLQTEDSRKVRASHRPVYKEFYLLGYDAAWLVESQPTFACHLFSRFFDPEDGGDVIRNVA